MLKKILLTSLAIGAVAIAVYAKAVGLGWNPYSDAAVNTIKVYIAPGANPFVANGTATANTNAVGLITTNVPSTATTVTVSVPFSGTWSAVATAVTTNGVESLNSNLASTNLPPGAPISLRFQ